MLGQAEVRSISTCRGSPKVSHRLYGCNKILRRGLKLKGEAEPKRQTASVLACWLTQYGSVTTAYDTVHFCVAKERVKGEEGREEKHSQLEKGTFCKIGRSTGGQK